MPPQTSRNKNKMKYVLLFFIKIYRLTLSKWLPRCCRFTPSCSEYAMTAIRRFGAVKGGYLTIRRLIRCNPFSPGGYDYVPQEFYFFKRKWLQVLCILSAIVLRKVICHRFLILFNRYAPWLHHVAHISSFTEFRLGDFDFHTDSKACHAAAYFKAAEKHGCFSAFCP